MKIYKFDQGKHKETKEVRSQLTLQDITSFINFRHYWYS